MTPLRRLWLAAALWWVWRRCDWVYRWAHHPLCGRFQHNVWRIGPLHLCRSCTLLYLSLALTVIVAWHAAPPWLVLWGMMALVLPLSHPLLYRKLPRPAKDLLRSGAGILAGLLLVLTVKNGLLAGLMHIAVVAAICAWYQRLRRGVLARACDGCPELDAGRTCSGFALQTKRILAFEPVATELVIRAGPPRLPAHPVTPPTAPTSTN